MNENKDWIKRLITGSLETGMIACRDEGISFTSCLATARRRFNKRLREAALKEQP